MNEIKIYLKPSGSTAELYKDFNLYQESYRNVQITIYVPTVLLYKNADNTFFNTVQTGAILTATTGAKVPTKGFNAAFVKTVKIDNVEYAEYTQIMPKEYTLYAGTQIIVCNVVSVDNTDASAPKVISVTTSQRVPLAVQESAYLSETEPLDPDDAQVIEGLINDLQEQLNNGTFAARAIYPWSDSYTYGLNELTFYPDKGEYGVFIKSLVADNKAEPYINGVLNGESWQEVADFNIINELYTVRGEVEQLAQNAEESANAAAQSSQSAAQSAQLADNAAKRIESEAEYIEGVKEGSIAVPKAIADSAGNNIANQFAVVKSDIEGLREDISNEAHFRGMFDSVEDLKEQYPTATPNDYAYIVGGDIWLYQNNEWTDSGKPSPNTSVPASKATPLMDGTGAAGTSGEYARGDHRHPTDTTRASAVDLANETTARENADEVLTETAEKNLYNLGAFDAVTSNGDGPATITRQTGYLNAKELTNMSWLPESISTVSTLNFYTPLPTGAKREIAYSNLFKGYATVGNDFKEGVPNIYVSAGGNLNIYPAVALNSVDEFKQWLSSNEFNIQFELAESYTETVIENQPIHTLDQNGEQWLREEWQKGLNLAQSNIVGTLTVGSEKWISVSNSTLQHWGLKVGKTYTVYTSPIVNSDGTSIACQLLPEYYSFSSQPQTFVFSNETALRIGNNTQTVQAQINQPIMLNEGSHPYPYQPYNGGIVREEDLETEINKKVSKSGDTMTGELTNVYQQNVRGYKSVDSGVTLATERSGFYGNAYTDYSKYINVGEGGDKFMIGYEYNDKRVHARATYNKEEIFNLRFLGYDGALYDMGQRVYSSKNPPRFKLTELYGTFSSVSTGVKTLRYAMENYPFLLFITRTNSTSNLGGTVLIPSDKFFNFFQSNDHAIGVQDGNVYITFYYSGRLSINVRSVWGVDAFWVYGVEVE